MEHPYKSAPARAFWKKAVSEGWNAADLMANETLLRGGDRVASAGSCFAANIVPFIEKAGFEYVRTEQLPSVFGNLAADNFSYGKFSAAYGNIYTVRQAVQLLLRALGRFSPREDRWIVGNDLIIDPFRPGLRYPASSLAEFDVLTAEHLGRVCAVFSQADVFVFTLGLTEAWVSRLDGAVFPACPGTVAGIFDPQRHAFYNFSATEVSRDLDEFIMLARELNPRLRLILTVSPVPLVATAADEHVLVATTYSKSVLRVAAGEAARRHSDVVYFPAYEIVTGPQAPHNFFNPDRREPSKAAIATVMRAFLSHCETAPLAASARPAANPATALTASAAPTLPSATTVALSAIVAAAECEEATAGL
jgi:GSCFA family